jgi:serine/threonine-protein kinase
LTAIDLANGESQLWQFPPGTGKNEPSLLAIYGTPVVSKGMVFLGGYDGILYALDLTDGSVKWAQATKGHIVGGPAVGGDTVYIGSADRCLYAFAADSGDARWGEPFCTGSADRCLYDFATDSGESRRGPFCTGNKIWSTPVVDEGTVYVASMDKKVYAVDTATGKPRWAQPFEADAAITSTPVVAGGKLYVGALNKRFYALDTATGELQWSFGGDDWIWNRAVVADGVVYVGNLAGHVYALDAGSGEMRWQGPFKAVAEIRAAPALVDKTLVVVDSEGNIYGLNAASGSQEWVGQAGSGVLADLLVAEGKVYVSTKSGDVLTVDPSNGSISTLVAAQ